jgi:exodeoxyribonuclease VII small subunit
MSRLRSQRAADRARRAIDVLVLALPRVIRDVAGAASYFQRTHLKNEMSSSAQKAAQPHQKGAFEKSLARLEEVVKHLESTDLSLDEAMSLFEEGVKLSQECQKQLEETEGRVEILLKRADGKIAAKPFQAEDESS